MGLVVLRVGMSLSHVTPPPQDASLGQVSFSKLGSFGAIIQVVLILYPSGNPRGFCLPNLPPSRLLGNAGAENGREGQIFI